MLFVTINIILTSKLYIMKSKKQVPEVKLQKSSVIFMQLGLILSLFIVYLIIEVESDYKPKVFAEIIDNRFDEVTTIGPVVVEPDAPRIKPTSKPPKVVVPVVKPPQVITNIQVIDNNSKTLETENTSTEVEPDEPVITTPVATPTPVPAPQTKEVEPVNINIVEYAPEYPGCTGSNEEKRACFNKKINKLVKRKFNTELAQTLGLNAGKKRISVQFIIDKNGEITNIKVRAPHKRLEKEALRVVKLLPRMKPARQGKNTAKVRFNLPIVFVVED